MAPILIDNRDLLKLGLTSVLIIVITFVGGYQLGQKQAKLGFAHQIDRPRETIMMPGMNEEQVANKESRKIESLTTEEIDSSLKKVVEVTPADEDQKKDTQPFKPKSKSSTLAVASSTEVEPEYRTDKLEKKAPELKESSASDNAVGQSHSDNSSGYDASSDNTSNDDDIKFSIQVAVYGRLKNAEKMMKSLQDKNLDAYVSDYTNKKNKRRFNVRIGYFKEKITALNALKNYIDVHQGDGYLVNFSKDNIVNIALEVPVNKEKTKAITRPDNKMPSAGSMQIKANQTDPNVIPITNMTKGGMEKIMTVDAVQSKDELNPDRVENISIVSHQH